MSAFLLACVEKEKRKKQIGGKGVRLCGELRSPGATTTTASNPLSLQFTVIADSRASSTPLFKNATRQAIEMQAGWRTSHLLMITRVEHSNVQMQICRMTIASAKHIAEN